MNKALLILPLLLILWGCFSWIGLVKAEEGYPLPQSAAVSGFVGNAQTYPLSCESRAAADIAVFWGVAASEKDIFQALPSSDDPNIGFVGDVNGKWGNIPPHDYGVHAAPIAAVLQRFGLEAQAVTGITFEELQTELALGRPVIVWVVGVVWNGIPQQYVTSQGNVVTVAAFEHTMVAVGYGPETITLVNSGDGKSAEYAISDFLASWGVLNNMAVFVKGKRDSVQTPTAASVLAPTQVSVLTPFPTMIPELAPPTLIWQYIVQEGDTLSALAEKWNVSLSDLAAYNQLTPPYTLLRGQVLFIPFTVVRLVSPVPSSVIELPQQPINGVPEMVSSTPVPPYRVYTVKRGDYLAKLAREWGTTWQEIARINGIGYPYQIYAGQVLQIP